MGPEPDAGTRLHTETVGAGAPRVVLVHGFTQTGRSWATVAARLAARHEVVTVDAPGHGGSSAAVPDFGSGADAIARAAGTGVYVGYSMGARYALMVTERQPDMVQGLVLLGANPGIRDEAERAARRASDEALALALEHDGVEAFLTRWLAQPLFASLPVTAADVADRQRNTAAGLAASLRRAGTGAQPDLWGGAAAIAVPVLVLAGERDAKFRAIGKELAAAVGDNATFAVIGGAGHAAHLERPDAFVDVVRAWLDQFMP